MTDIVSHSDTVSDMETTPAPRNAWWTEDEVKHLMESRARGVSFSAIAADLRRSWSSVSHKYKAMRTSELRRDGRSAGAQKAKARFWGPDEDRLILATMGDGPLRRPAAASLAAEFRTGVENVRYRARNLVAKRDAGTLGAPPYTPGQGVAAPSKPPARPWSNATIAWALQHKRSDQEARYIAAVCRDRGWV